MNVKEPAPSLKAAEPALTANIVANASTVFIIRTAATTWKSFTGVANLPTYTVGAPYDVIAVNNAGGFAALAYIDLVGVNADASNSIKPIYILSATPSSTAKVGTTTYFNYAAIIDGEVTTFKSENAAIGAVGLYTIDKDTNGYVTAVNPYVDSVPAGALPLAQTAAATVKLSGYTLKIGANAFATTDSTVAYIYNRNTGALTVGTPADLSIVSGKTNNFIVLGSVGNPTATVIYQIVELA